ncbi:MAG: Uncharacterized protein XD74_2145 [Actinobacteria bacterium 66_15]|nr:MAG: Uncharacterized protein XD74_2145 [Actinobacteria bacterium 66_15]
MGNAASVDVAAPLIPVHPHVHGERFAGITHRASTHGSSPRAWGTHLIPNTRHTVTRFIPTCMGNAQFVVHPDVIGSVHPHVHGERILSPLLMPVSGGSSPRAWGTLHPGRWKYPDERFIPTCMGNAPSYALPGYGMSVHPHVHGERRIHNPDGREYDGSSPRAWGTHHRSQV